jgi:glutaredoxin 3
MARVEIYSSDFCGFCYRAKSLLRKKGVTFEEHDVTMDPAGRDAMMTRSGGKRSVPQIFINDEHIGGCDDLHALDAQGKLDAMLAA